LVPRIPETSPAPDWSALAADPPSLLSSVTAFYAQTARESSEVAAYLSKRGLDHPGLMDRFRLGYANRTLGLWLPDKQLAAGAKVRGALQRLGVLRTSGHEVLRGSLVVPVCDASGAVVQLYGRKLMDHQRDDVPLHVWLPGPQRGVFNLDGWRGAEDVVLCGSLIDALTVWCAGEHRVTAACGADGFTDELLQALVREGVRRVRVAFVENAVGHAAARAVAVKLSAVGIETLRVMLPMGRDANACAVQSGLPALARAIEDAEPFALSDPSPQSSPSAALTLPLVPAAMQHAPPPTHVALAPVQAPLPAPALAPAPAPPAPAHEADDCEVSAEQIVVRYSDRRYRVRGLARALGAESMKVNVLVSIGELLHIDTLDLYAAKARTVFVQQAASALSVDASVIARDVARLLLQLEAWQAEAIASAVTAQPSVAALSAEEEASGLALLRDPQLVDRIVRDVAAVGVVGEDGNALLGYLAAVSRKLEKPLAVLIQSTSAAGKSTLMDALLSLMPEHERVHYSAMTGQSLFYLGEGDLRHKILAIAEEEGVRQAAYALKLLQSQGELTIASTGKDPQTGKLVTEEYRVQGPVMLCLTTTAIDLDEELLNRCLVLTIDESREQTEAIHARQRQARTLAGLVASREVEAIQRSHRAAQTLLRPLAVVNPFAEQLTFRSESTRTRRDHAKYLTLIDAIALLHQYQRPVRTANVGGAVIEYIEATQADIALANRLASEVLGRSLDELPPQTRRVLARIAALVETQMQERSMARAAVRFTRRELRAVVGMTDTALRIHLERLIALEYVLVHRGQRGQSFVYELLFDGDAATLAPQMAGLIEVGTTPTAPNVTPVGPKFTPPATEFARQSAKFTPPLHPQHTPIAPSSHPSEVVENNLKNSGSVASDAEVVKKALLGKPKKHTPAQRSHGSLS
jgi:DNA primase